MRFFVYLLIFLTTGTPISLAQENTQPQSVSNISVADQALLNKDLSGAVRGFVWGLSPTVILENERGTFMDEENGRLFYLDNIRGLKSTIGYEFDDNQLSRAQIFIEKRFTDPQDRIESLLTIQTDLNKRFGEPVVQDFRWRNEREKNFPENWGWAVYRGELFITLQWQNEQTDVTAYLGAKKQFSPELSVTYESRAVKAAKAQSTKRNLLSAP